MPVSKSPKVKIEAEPCSAQHSSNDTYSSASHPINLTFCPFGAADDDASAFLQHAGDFGRVAVGRTELEQIRVLLAQHERVYQARCNFMIGVSDHVSPVLLSSVENVTVA